MTSRQAPALQITVGAMRRHGGRNLEYDRDDTARYEVVSVTGRRRAYVVAAVAAGVETNDASGAIAEAAVEMACTLAAGEDFAEELPHLIRTVAVALPALADYGATGRSQALRSFGERNPQPHPDTTLTVVAVDECTGDITVGWIGDTRCYVQSVDGRLHLLTRDHNEVVVNDQTDQRLRGALLRTLSTSTLPGRGPQGSRWDAWNVPSARPRRVLLCTGGVYGVLGDSEIAEALAVDGPGLRAAKRLTSLATEQGGPDAENATALVIDIEPAEKLAIEHAIV